MSRLRDQTALDKRSDEVKEKYQILANGFPWEQWSKGRITSSTERREIKEKNQGDAPGRVTGKGKIVEAYHSQENEKIVGTQHTNNRIEMP